jgi:hypothetical protein
METSTATKVDYVMLGRTALARIEKFEAEIESAESRVKPLCREAWRDYGAALLAQRVLMPSDQQFGQWVKANGLDRGRASKVQVRSDAMWLAECFDSIKPFDTVTQRPAPHAPPCRPGARSQPTTRSVGGGSSRYAAASHRLLSASSSS